MPAVKQKLPALLDCRGQVWLVFLVEPMPPQYLFLSRDGRQVRFLRVKDRAIDMLDAPLPCFLLLN